MSPEEQEEMQRNISNGVYRGNFQSKHGWDPGDPDKPAPPGVEIAFIMFVIALAIGYIWHQI